MIEHNDTGLAELIRLMVTERTTGRMRDIQVYLRKGRICVRGVTSSYYVKQLAIQGVLGALEGSEPHAVDIDIRVDDADAPIRTAKAT